MSSILPCSRIGSSALADHDSLQHTLPPVLLAVRTIPPAICEVGLKVGDASSPVRFPAAALYDPHKRNVVLVAEHFCSLSVGTSLLHGAPRVDLPVTGAFPAVVSGVVRNPVLDVFKSYFNAQPPY